MICTLVIHGGVGGVIMTTPTGDSACYLSTPAICRNKAGSDGTRIVAIYGDEA